MKKLVLSLVFLLAAGTMMNASSNITLEIMNLDEFECAESSWLKLMNFKKILLIH